MPRDTRNENTHICVKSVNTFISIFNILNPTEVFLLLSPILQIWEQGSAKYITEVEFKL